MEPIKAQDPIQSQENFGNSVNYKPPSRDGIRVESLELNIRLKFKTTEEMEQFLKSQTYRALKNRTGKPFAHKWWGPYQDKNR
jgi:hypothetical protein